MKHRALLAACLLSGCQTISVQGVEITRDEQLWVSAIMIAGAVIVADLAKGANADAEKSACKTLASVPEEKGGETFCAIPLD